MRIYEDSRYKAKSFIVVIVESFSVVKLHIYIEGAGPALVAT